tara:strand:+ start:126 stop:317 length:192 start_codon:yes stop_codon:yes gene_type:complete
MASRKQQEFPEALAHSAYHIDAEIIGRCLDSRIKCNMIEITRRRLVEKLLRALKVIMFSWPGA